MRVAMLFLEANDCSGHCKNGAFMYKLYRCYSVSGYKMLPSRQLRDAMEWLTELNG